MKRSNSNTFDSNWDLDDIDDWATFFPPTKRARRVSTSIPFKSVRFATEDEVILIDRSKDELKRAWYSSSDWHDFRSECRQIVASIAKTHSGASYVEQEEYCIRGLEEFIFATLCRKSSTQRLIVRQIVQGQHAKDQTALRDAYLKLSEKHRSRALRRAIAAVNAGSHFSAGKATC